MYQRDLDKESLNTVETLLMAATYSIESGYQIAVAYLGFEIAGANKKNSPVFLIHTSFLINRY